MKKKKIYLTEVVAGHKNMDYQQLYSYVLSEIEKKHLIPIKASGLNGKKPALYNSYWLTEQEKEETDISEELKYKIHPLLDTTYYQKYPKRYQQEKKEILLLSDYLTKSKNCLNTSETINERSFEIFHREKFLDREGGMDLLSRLGISAEDLNFYRTSEPMSYYSRQKQTPQNFLIIENKDTFYSMRRYLINGNQKIFDLKIETLIYGGGKGIYKTFEDYVSFVESYFADKNNQVYYFGDLDYEGILIYEILAEKYKHNTDIILFVQGYKKMLEKAEIFGIDELPDTKEGQNRNIGEKFFSFFEKDYQEKIRNILELGKYIPQEIVNEADYQKCEK